MNEEMISTYNRFIISSQRTMNDIVNVINNQESALRRYINGDYNNTRNTIYTLRHENEELRRIINNNNINHQLPRFTTSIPTPNPTPNPTPIHIPIQRNTIPYDSIIGSHRTTTNRSNDNRRNTMINSNIGNNNQSEYIRRYFNNNFHGLLIDAIGQNLSPVVVRPSALQIREATEVVRFGNIFDPPNNSCPISLERFNNDQLVTRIIYCGHIFSSEIQTWFETNVRCPLCRFDIREHRNNQTSRNNLSAINETDSQQHTIPEPDIENESESATEHEPQHESQHESQHEPEHENEHENEPEPEVEFNIQIRRNVDNLLNDNDNAIANEITTQLMRSLSNNLRSFSFTPLDSSNNNINTGVFFNNIFDLSHNFV